MSIEAMEQALEALENNKRMHHYCEDTWYSCPKHEDGCANEADGDECNCGADEANAEINEAITALRQAIEKENVVSSDTSQDFVDETAKQRHEPVAWYDSKSGWVDFHSFKPVRKPSAPDAEWLPLYTSPPQRQPLTNEQIFEVHKKVDSMQYLTFARAIEAAHGIKE